MTPAAQERIPNGRPGADGEETASAEMLAQLASEAGLAAVPASALRFEPARERPEFPIGLRGTVRLTTFLRALAQAGGVPPGGQRAAEAAITTLDREPAPAIDRLATLVAAGASSDDIARAGRLDDAAWALAALYQRMVGPQAPADPDRTGAALERAAASLGSPETLRHALARLQETGLIEPGTGIPLDPTQPYMPPLRPTRTAYRLLGMAGLAPT